MEHEHNTSQLRTLRVGVLMQVVPMVVYEILSELQHSIRQRYGLSGGLEIYLVTHGLAMTSPVIQYFVREGLLLLDRKLSPQNNLIQSSIKPQTTFEEGFEKIQAEFDRKLGQVLWKLEPISETLEEIYRCVKEPAAQWSEEKRLNAEKWYRQGLVNDALIALQLAISPQYNPTNFAAHRLLGHILLYEYKNYSEALSCFQKAALYAIKTESHITDSARLTVEAAECHLFAAISAYFENQLEIAISECDAALQLNSELLEANYVKAKCLARIGNILTAVTALKPAVATYYYFAHKDPDLNKISEVKLFVEDIMQDNVAEVIGLDLGDGDTAISKLPMESDSAPERLDIHGKKKQITAIGFEAEGKVEVGEIALLSRRIKNLHINFKERPTESNYSRLEVLFKPYITEIYRLLRKSNDIRGGEFSMFTVGCPSGWKQGTSEAPSERELYEQLLRVEGIPLLKVVPESRAAFVHAKDSRKFTVSELLSAVLIVDIGSSTTDFTLIRNLREKPQDFGENRLGASLIDEAIFVRSLSQHKNKQQVEELFEQEPSLKERCKLACRSAKEAFFSQEGFYKEEPQQKVGNFNLELSEDLDFRPIVTYDSIQEILNAPQNRLFGQSWKAYFEATLSSIKAELEREGIAVSILLMTGGASKMGFTRDICRKIFAAVDISESNDIPANTTIFYADSEPEHCIADGLARVGRWDLLANKFKKEVKALIDRGEVKQTVQDHINELIDLIAEALSDDFINNVIKLTLKQWQQREILTFEDAEVYAEHLIEERRESEEVKNIIREICRDWLSGTGVLEDLNNKTQPICRKFKIEESGLDLRANIDPNVKSPPIPLEDVLGGERFSNLVTGVADLIRNILVVGGWLAAIFAAFHTWWLWIVGLIFKRDISNVLEGLADQVKKWLNALLEKFRQWGIERLTKEDIPVLARGLLLNDESINALCESKKSDLSRELKLEMRKEEGSFSEDVARMVGEAIEAALTERAEQAVILIK